MALPSSFTMLPIHISNPPKPKSFIICATPKRRKTSTGSGGKINSVLKISTRSIVGVKDVNDSNTTTVKEINGEYDHKSYSSIGRPPITVENIAGFAMKLQQDLSEVNDKFENMFTKMQKE
ncbi:hypothetical protein GOBAR_DD08106 [Gossypium barbadense]|nr:hypothetical protein GOBAR_DD08106 [Gossypium barbadense]